MKNSIILTIALFLFTVGITHADHGEPCDCATHHKGQLESFLNGEHKAFVLEEHNFYSILVNDRLSIMEGILNHSHLIQSKKPAISSSIKSLKSASGQLKKLKSEISTAIIDNPKKVESMVKKIHDYSISPLRNSSKILYGSYHMNENPPILVLNPGGNPNCEEGETPPNFDCNGIGASVNRDCLDAIQEKQECGYYSQEGQDNQQTFENDMNACTTAAENASSRCQTAVSSCDHTYDPRANFYDFWRRASLACSQREINNRPGETENNIGN